MSDPPGSGTLSDEARGIDGHDLTRTKLAARRHLLEAICLPAGEVTFERFLSRAQRINLTNAVNPPGAM
ncbi:hypothetical protein CO671_03085 [Rhizobium sp. M10]|uniref:hypothetical protein n=1 Tax=Rhizobium sp. M10 TaxID=1324586 RepID=UPI000BEA18DB|nr:hypothetical protein [Rhizobium sp. M10]PDT38388.1 hypothetical protein CO671_03085 [Rhizobium sp. M10]